MAAMMGLYFLVLLSVGLLRPIRNTLALDGLGQTDFYKVYLVSALVIAFVPVLNHLSDRVPWRRLIPSVALFFALNLLVFRAFYTEGSTLFGLVFYGWYDLFAAALVTQLFMVTQLFFHARLARHAYPIVIAGGALGASAGGAITGFLAETLGTPNLLLVATGIIGVFSLAVVLVWSMEGMVPEAGPSRKKKRPESGKGLGFRAIFSNRQVLLITSLVLATILVKQLVDYQFNTITKEVFVERDAIASFQGKFGAATQWLPILVLLGIRKPLKRWGVGFAVLVLPVAMLLTNAGLILFWGLWTAVAAKGAEQSFRYSAERAGREILYVPVPDEIKLKAKAYIDVAIEKGLGKVLSAGLIFLLLTRMEYRQVAWAGAALAVAWIFLALAVRREYVHSLARAVENRFASLHGVFASLGDPESLRVIREALSGDDRQAAFALDLLAQAPPGDSEALRSELEGLLERDSPELRRRALDLLARIPDAVDPGSLRRQLSDPDPGVREAAVRALLATASGPEDGILVELLDSPDPQVRTAVLSCLARGEIRRDGLDLPARLRAGPAGRSRGAESADARIERALVAAALRPPSAVRTIQELLDDPDPQVVRTALRGAGFLGEAALHPALIAGLGSPALRDAAREALVTQGVGALPELGRTLLDETGEPGVRRQIPSVLARIPRPETIDVLVRSVLAPETDQVLDHRAIKALSKLRARDPDLAFDPAAVGELLDRSLEAAHRLARIREALRSRQNGGPTLRLLAQAVSEAWEERREEVFRCLGLLHAPNDVHRCYVAVVRGEMVPRANALEWLESTIGFDAFQRLLPLVGEGPAPAAGEDPIPILRELMGDEDHWIACLAKRAIHELQGVPEGPHPSAGRSSMDLVEIVFLLQHVDVLRDARTAHLALLASIAEEVDVDTGTVLIRRNEPAEALHVVVRGRVELKGPGGDLSLTDGMAFGTWALIDAVPSLVEVRAAAPSRLLRIDQAEFHDLLSDHPEMAIGMLQGLARRVRALVT
jgi:ATP:ADP antiporter, AAA family